MKQEEKERVCYVYILRCADDSFYTGWTKDVAERLKAHNGIIPNGAKYTKSRRPVTVRWVAACENRMDAQRLEYYIKRCTRAKKTALISGDEKIWQKLQAPHICKGRCTIVKDDHKGIL